ncbi:MAG: hypothetical protein MJ178_01725 [Treponemataceae bacterium]|nr:hypothetical protein [Treponemataceae bacterium]
MKKITRYIVLFTACLCAAGYLSAQTLADRGFAEDEFRNGVLAYYRGAYNDAVLQFEKALSYLPEENLILEWLGKAYYRAGLEGEALAQWKLAQSNGYGGPLLESVIEIVQNRRAITSQTVSDKRYVEMGNYPQVKDGVLYFAYPASILPNSDGSFWLAAFGSDEIIRYDANGHIVERSNGPLNGFDRPMDLLRLHNGSIVVSEYAGDRLSFLDKNCRYVSSFGETGRGDGQLLGPQYLAKDESENIFVTDFGNGRVCVFDSTGTFLYHFGHFTAPTGIAVFQDRVFVADGVTGAIYVYDTFGNEQGLLVSPGTLEKPEAIRVVDGKLVVCDTNRVLVINPDTGAGTVIADTGNGPARITCADVDANGNLIAADFDSGEVYVLAEMSELVGGLYVDIARVNADAFPKVKVEVRVQNRKRQPVAGLTEQNFLITEGTYSVTNQTFTGAADRNDAIDITVIIDRSLSMAQYETEVAEAVTSIAASMNGKGTFRVVCAGDIPATELIGTPNSVKAFQMSQLKTGYSSRPGTDLAIRLAANDLVNGELKRAIVYIGNGESSDSSFTRYSLNNLSSYLANNGISFACVNVRNGALSSQLKYIVENTTGESYYLYRPEGISSIASDLQAVATGVYILEFTSNMPTDFGRKFLPVEMEVYLMNRSGRASTGYFAPLE